MLDNMTKSKDSEIPQEVESFVRRHFRSVASLEVFLFVRSMLPGGITADDLSNEMRSNPVYSAALLNELLDKGLLTSQESKTQRKYFCNNNEKDKDIYDKVTAYYVQKRVRIINLIYNASAEKIQDFADAFKIRK
jgi:hypothetical protein